MPVQPVGVTRASAIIGMLAMTIAQRMGRAPLAALLKNSRRDWSSSSLFSFMIVQSRPIGSPDWTDWFIKKKRESLYPLLFQLIEALALPV